jgi:hypothetical protein
MWMASCGHATVATSSTRSMNGRGPHAYR